MKDESDIIRKRVEDHDTAVSALTDQHIVIADIAGRIAKSFRAGGVLILCGNGGSAADAEHVAGEFLGRYKLERKPLPAIALTANAPVVTAVGNDYGFEHVFARQVQAFAKRADVVVGISTSGNSKNVLNAISEARNKGCVTIGVTSKSGGALAGMVDVCFRAGSNDTPRVQEAHILMWHIVCELVERELAGPSGI